jgi:hypothetical protein
MDIGFTNHHDGNPVLSPNPSPYRCRDGLEDDEGNKEQRGGVVEVRWLRSNSLHETCNRRGVSDHRELARLGCSR